MKIAVLTSSRADYGIYLPLLKALKEDTYFDLKIIAFGTHLSYFHGHTIDQILSDGFEVDFRIETVQASDTPNAISTSIGITFLKFADFWNSHQNEFDIVFSLGDRYEMFAAVYSGIPFNIKFAHLHGGETTLGAFDNIYRHAITLTSKLHFVSTDNFAKRIHEITGSDENCVVTGSLSLDKFSEIKLQTKEEFNLKWQIDLSSPSILITVHPETVAFRKNQNFAEELYKALYELTSTHQLIVTMPNADTSGSIYRRLFVILKELFPLKVFLIENLGKQSYFTCMKYASLLIGNSSSGIIEAASFEKYVINIGDRQKGRLTSENTVHVPFDHKLIIDATFTYADKVFLGKNIYYRNSPVQKIINKLKST